MNTHNKYDAVIAAKRATMLCTDLKRSIQDLLRYLKEKHGEPIYLHEKLIPDAFREVQHSRGVSDSLIRVHFLEKLSGWNKAVWLCFILNLESMTTEAVVEEADVESFKALSPCPCHHKRVYARRRVRPKESFYTEFRD